MNPFEEAYHIGMSITGKKYIPREYDSFPELIQFMKKANKDLRILTGELAPNLFERSEIIEVMKSLIEKMKVNIHIVFHKSDSKDRAIEELNLKNKHLSYLKSKHNDRLKLYWTPYRPEAHYAVVDERHLLLEGEHEEGEKRDTFFIYNNAKIANKWVQLFDQYIAKEVVQQIQ